MAFRAFVEFSFYASIRHCGLPFICYPVSSEMSLSSEYTTNPLHIQHHTPPFKSIAVDRENPHGGRDCWFFTFPLEKTQLNEAVRGGTQGDCIRMDFVLNKSHVVGKYFPWDGWS